MMATICIGTKFNREAKKDVSITVDTADVSAIHILNDGLSIGTKSGLSLGIGANERPACLRHILSALRRHENRDSLDRISVLTIEREAKSEKKIRRGNAANFRP